MEQNSHNNNNNSNIIHAPSDKIPSEEGKKHKGNTPKKKKKAKQFLPNNEALLIYGLNTLFFRFFDLLFCFVLLQ